MYEKQLLIADYEGTPRIYAIDSLMYIPCIGLSLQDIDTTPIVEVLRFYEKFSSYDSFKSDKQIKCVNNEKFITEIARFENFIMCVRICHVFTVYKNLILVPFATQDFKTAKIGLFIVNSIITKQDFKKFKKPIGRFLTNLTYELYSKL